MKCARCNLMLAPGAHHVTAEDCIEALCSALTTCPKCGGTIGCLKCAAKRVVRRAVDQRAPGAMEALQILGNILRPEEA